MVSGARVNKPYVYISKDKFELNCNGWTLFLAMKVLFEQVKKTQPSFYGLLCRKLIDCKAFDPNSTGMEAVSELYKNPHKKA